MRKIISLYHRNKDDLLIFAAIAITGAMLMAPTIVEAIVVLAKGGKP